jgi:plasmid stability protein
MNIILKDIPNALHERLKERARNHGRSLDHEALAILESAISPSRKAPSALLDQIVNRRNKLSFSVEHEEIQALINEGRE